MDYWGKRIENVNINFNRSGGGYYNENGMKIKQWTEIHENYQNQLFTR
jgi:hypothetical protein